MATAKKTTKRMDLLKIITDVISHKNIYDVIDYKNKKEDSIKQFMYQPLFNEIKKYYTDKNLFSESTCTKKAEKSVTWEASKKDTLHNLVLFGTQHRPDMEIDIENTKIAIEVKKGQRGSDIRNGFGQSIVYSSNYDFVILLFVDISDDKRIKNSVNGEKEKDILDSLWNNYNIKLKVV